MSHKRPGTKNKLDRIRRIIRRCDHEFDYDDKDLPKQGTPIVQCIKCGTHFSIRTE